MLCLSGEIPEIDHNQIVGWIDGVRDDRNCPVILRPSSEEGMNARALYATIDLMVDSGLDPVIVDLEGDTPLANALHGIMIGDFVSYYLAMMREVDPLPVPAITELRSGWHRLSDHSCDQTLPWVFTLMQLTSHHAPSFQRHYFCG